MIYNRIAAQMALGMIMNNVLKRVLFAAGIFVVAEAAMACTRVVYLGNNDVMTARSMDWKSDIGTNLWILPNSVKRNGMAWLQRVMTSPLPTASMKKG